jgi:hypothetical protein
MFDRLQSTLYTIIVCTNSVYTLAALFLPIVFLEKEISGIWVGIIFSAYSFAVVIVSPYVGKL